MYTVQDCLLFCKMLYERTVHVSYRRISDIIKYNTFCVKNIKKKFWTSGDWNPIRHHNTKSKKSFTKTISQSSLNSLFLYNLMSSNFEISRYKIWCRDKLLKDKLRKDKLRKDKLLTRQTPERQTPDIMKFFSCCIPDCLIYEWTVPWIQQDARWISTSRTAVE